MKKENLKQILVNRITDYVVGAIDNDFVEEEMLGVKESMFIIPAAGEGDKWTDQGCVIIWKDADGKSYVKMRFQLGGYAASFGDLVVNGRSYIEDIAGSIYSEIFEE